MEVLSFWFRSSRQAARYGGTCRFFFARAGAAEIDQAVCSGLDRHRVIGVPLIPERNPSPPAR